MAEQKLAGRTALVTGGSRGLGAAAARRLAREGADVAITYVHAKDKAEAVVDELKGLGVRAAAFQADQGKPDEVIGMVGRVAERFGRIDILVNNAGVFVTGPIGALSLDDITRQWAVNVRGMVAATLEAIKYMPDGGRIVNLGSVNGERSAAAGLGDYAATKAAVAAYTRSWAHDLAPRKITVNTVLPGPSDTDMGIPQESDLGTFVLGLLPYHRYASPDEVAAVIAFLAGPDASYTTGGEIRVDGGWNA
ncbi:SDR family NAD(P)-dependent oxidoreductase [Actinacidiphila sp. bgisy167]|uniref:SDR family NAD(P)-dependent oxidoreductase n=1 Tax=Actinacidiphila sp. bgisy167 TaxID=3413797 RepID=UPI003D733D1B